MTATADRTRAIGQPLRRREDDRLLTGRTRWTDNITPAGTLHIALLRSPMAHARITRIDVTPALARPGVVAAFSGADLADDWAAGLPCAWPVTEDIKIPDHYALTADIARHAGDPVAVVVAESRYQAADALEAIEVDYEPLPPVLDLEEALQDRTLVHQGLGSNRSFTWHTGTDNVDEVFGQAEVVVERRYIQQRLIPNAMEPRAVVAIPPQDTAEYVLYSSTQVPHVLRFFLAVMSGIPENQIRVVAPDVGGGFGSKLQVYGEEILALVLAKKLARPVKWTETRSENFQATHHGRGQLQDIAIAATRDGKILGLKVDLKADMGAYLMIITPGTPILGAYMFNGIYKMDASSFTCTGVFTNRTPTDAYRGAGRPEATFGIERIVDDLAAELGIEPMELRRRNWIRHEEFPYTTVSGMTYDSGNYEAATDRAMQLFDYEALRAEQAKRRASGDPVQLGIGISTFTEMCGWAPSRIIGSLRYAGGGWESATVEMLPTGKVTVVTGTSPHGQSHLTTFSQIAADALGVDPADVDLVHGDTLTSPTGWDTYGSRSLVVGGIAIELAAQRLVERARVIAAHALEADPDDLEFVNGTFRVKGTPGATKTIQDVAVAAWTAHDLPDGVEPRLTASYTFDPEALSFPHGTHLCAIDVDTETGLAKIRSYVCVDDVGTVINPLIVEGQVHGGLAQGIAQALFEEAVYDDAGNLVTGSLVDYLVPAAPDLPHFVTDRTETPATTNPLGVKGVGEAGTIASTPAVVNAIVDALRPYGVTDVQMPCTPERIWRAIREGTSGGDSTAAGHVAYGGPTTQTTAGGGAL